MRRVRERLVSEHPQSDAAAEAHYKVGLDAMFRERDLVTALAQFKLAVARKHAFWSAAARTSLALCHYHQNKTQKALFELRKVALVDAPNVHSVTALSFMETIFANAGNLEEVSRNRQERIKQLEKLLAQPGVSPQDQGHFLVQLAEAHELERNFSEAKGFYQRAQALGPDKLGADRYRAVVDAMRRVP
jgi:tetratricopeptide (TPR) repeat protein